MAPVVHLRPVEPADLAVFYEHQADEESARLAAFKSRPPEAFAAHWQKILANPACLLRTVVEGNRVVGNIGSWTDGGTQERMVGYWIGRSDWGRGIASRAVAQFLEVETGRPLAARVARHNPASLRVLQKCGFVVIGADRFEGHDGSTIEESILVLTEQKRRTERLG